MDKDLNEVFTNFTDFLKAHNGDRFTRDAMEKMPCPDIQEKLTNIMTLIRPVAVDILVEKEREFVAAITHIVEKHKSLETVEEIDKFTKDLLKLCK